MDNWASILVFPINERVFRENLEIFALCPSHT